MNTCQMINQMMVGDSQADDIVRLVINYTPEGFPVAFTAESSIDLLTLDHANKAVILSGTLISDDATFDNSYIEDLDYSALNDLSAGDLMTFLNICPGSYTVKMKVTTRALNQLLVAVANIERINNCDEDPKSEYFLSLTAEVDL